MIQIDFSQNFNGKLFNDCFSDVRLSDEIYRVGEHVEIILKGINLGVAKIVAVRPFPYSKITDVCGYLNVGKPAAYLADIIRRYNGGNIKNDRCLDHVIFQYTNRNIEAQSELLTDWWKAKTQ